MNNREKVEALLQGKQIQYRDDLEPVEQSDE